MKNKRKIIRLPNTVADLGIVEQMGEGPYYEKKDSLNYVVFFNIGFDNHKSLSISIFLITFQTSSISPCFSF